MRATMDFFEAQELAHRQTLRLVGLFIAAVVALIALTVLLIGVVVAYNMPPAGLITVPKLLHAMSPGLVGGISAGVVVVVVVASLFRLLSLSRGGRAVAETLGGRMVQPNTDDPDERRLLNVVEEMALAASLPVPPVFVIDEEGINAFAAGYSPDDAVIGVTEGTLHTLDRDELQGVIGHEFSHVLNGDMRLNIRLMSVLFGILVIGIIGRTLLRGSGRSRSSSGKGGQGAMIGLGLLIIGYVGTFFGSLIKAAVSRQREFLADASAVQFTRNPDGVAGALKKIGASVHGSSLQHPRADEMSHMFFGQAFNHWFGGMMATHPPLDERIHAVDPNWDGRYPEIVERAEAEPEPEPTPETSLEIAPGIIGAAIAGAAALDGRLGSVTPEDVARAHELIQGIPKPLYDAAHDPFGARAVIYVLLLDADDGVRGRQREHLDAHAETGVPALLDALTEAREALPEGSRLHLIQLSMPALKALSDAQYERFMDNVVELIKADQRLELGEWILHRLLMKELAPQFTGVRRRREGRAALEQMEDAVTTLLSTLARLGHDHDNEGRQAFEAGARALDMPGLVFEREEDRNLKRLNAALRQLSRLHPLARPKLLKAAVTCIGHDGVIEPREHDLLYALAATLDCPMPPLGATPA